MEGIDIKTPALIPTDLKQITNIVNQTISTFASEKWKHETIDDNHIPLLFSKQKQKTNEKNNKQTSF